MSKDRKPTAQEIALDETRELIKRLKTVVEEKLKARGEFQKEIEEALGLAPRSLSTMLSDKIDPADSRSIRLWQIVGLAHYFKIAPIELIETLAKRSHHNEWISWQENLELVPFEQRDYLQKGIDFFHACVGHGIRTHEEIRRTYNENRRPYWQMQAALRSGVLRITHIKRSPLLEAEVYNRFKHLRTKDDQRPWIAPNHIVVADIPNDTPATLLRSEIIAFLAARHAFPNEDVPEYVAFGGGYTVYRMCEQTPFNHSSYRDVTWVPFYGYAPLYSDNFRSPNHIVRTLQSRHPLSKCKRFPFTLRKSKSDVNFKAMQEILDMCRKAKVAFTTVNGPGRGVRGHADEFRSSDYDQQVTIVNKIIGKRKEKNNNAFFGEILNNVFDENGNVDILTEQERGRINQFATPVSLEVLSTIADQGVSWILASRLYKARAVQIALEKRWSNGLVIDKEIAEYLIHSEPI